MVYATVLILVIWLVASFQFAHTALDGVHARLVCMIAEWPRLTYIDDNATMELDSSALVMLLEPYALVMA